METVEGLPLQVEDITSKLSKGAQILLSRRVSNIILEYNEERPCAADFKSRSVRYLKKLLLTLGWKYIYRHPMGWVNAMFFNHYRIPGQSLSYKFYNLLETWREEIFLRRISPAIYIGIKVKKSELEAGYVKLSNLIEFSLGSEVIKGALSGAMSLELARFPGDEEQVYALLAYVHTNHVFANLVHDLMATEDGRKRLDRFFLIREGEMPKGLNA